MSMIATHNEVNHGVAFDVSKAELLVHCLPADTQCVIANTSKAARRLLTAELKKLHKLANARLLVVCEAPGGYERHVLEVCVALGIACHGSRVRFFARYLGV